MSIDRGNAGERGGFLTFALPLRLKCALFTNPRVRNSEPSRTGLKFPGAKATFEMTGLGTPGFEAPSTRDAL